MEEWRPVPGYNGTYEVSNLGNVRSWTTWSKGALMKQRAHTKTGHMLLNLTKDGKPTTHRVHQLVIVAFIGPRPEGLEVRHLNGDPADNRLENLRYGTRAENFQDAVEHGTAAPLTMRNKAKTHCDNGHEFTVENTYKRTQGWRSCRECGRQAQRAWFQRKQQVLNGPSDTT